LTNLVILYLTIKGALGKVSSNSFPNLNFISTELNASWVVILQSIQDQDF